MSESTTKDYSALYLPGAIVLAGALVAVGLFFGLSHGTNGATAGGQPAPKDVNVKDVKIDGAPFIGKADAPLTMAFWSDYQCPFCKAVEVGGVQGIPTAPSIPDIVAKYVDTGKLRIVFKNFAFLGQDSFSAAKTFQQTQAISALLVDENGNVRSSREFNKLGRELYDTWNDNYGVTEYNTAIAQADAAVKWQEIERQKDIVPMLKYSAIGDACSICMPLDGLTAHVDSKIWDKIAPTNHFNCKCLLLQYDESEKATENPTEIVNPVVEKMKERGQDIFINNVGKTGEIFTSEHPYFDVAKEYRELAKQNFNLPLPKFQYATD